MSDFDELLDEVLREGANAPTPDGMEQRILAHLPSATYPRSRTLWISTAAAVLLATFAATLLHRDHPAPHLTSTPAYSASASPPAFTQTAIETSREPAIKMAAHHLSASDALSQKSAIAKSAIRKSVIHIDPIAIQPIEIKPVSVRRVQLEYLTTDYAATKGELHENF